MNAQWTPFCPAAGYCLVYNDYTGMGNPAGCAAKLPRRAEFPNPAVFYFPILLCAQQNGVALLESKGGL